MHTKTLTKTETLTLDKEILFVVLNNEKYSDFKILNNTMQSYITSGISYPYVVLNYNDEDIRKILKPYLKKAELLVVLFSNIPLISAKTIENIVEYSLVKNVNACKLPCGFVFNSKYLKKNKVLSFDAIYSQNEDEFLEVLDEETLKFATRILQDRIIKYHAKNGVKFENEHGVIIEPNVDISFDVTISSNCYIKGNSKILQGSNIKENTTIIDSIIEKNVTISNSQIINSVIGEKSIVMPYSYILNSTIGKDVLIKSNNRLENATISDNKTIE